MPTGQSKSSKVFPFRANTKVTDPPNFAYLRQSSQLRRALGEVGEWLYLGVSMQSGTLDVDAVALKADPDTQSD